MTHPIYFSRPAVLCAAGSNRNELWDSCLNGNQSGIKKTTALNGKEFLSARIDDALLPPSSGRFDMRIIRIEEKCLEQIEDLIFLAKKTFGDENIGVCVGSCDNGTEFSVAGHRAFFENGAFPDDYSIERQSADYVATFISEKYGLKGPSLAFSTACSSSSGAIIKAAQLLDAGMCDAIIAGGVDIASDTVLMGFDALEAISQDITNPFSKNRKGITLGEGAAFFLMTREPLFVSKNGARTKGAGNAGADARDDSAIPHVALLGYGESADAYHLTSPAPDGEGAFRAMDAALKSARLKPCDIDYINLHGTGTKFNDSMETKAVDEIFGSYTVPCSSTKPLVGHTLGAAGALECAICVETLVNNFKSDTIRLPLHVWDGERDGKMANLNFIGRGGGIAGKKVEVCMTNSFAFGGANASLIVGIV